MHWFVLGSGRDLREGARAPSSARGRYPGKTESNCYDPAEPADCMQKADDFEQVKVIQGKGGGGGRGRGGGGGGRINLKCAGTADGWRVVMVQANQLISGMPTHVRTRMNQKV